MSMTPGKHLNNKELLEYSRISRHVFWNHEEQIDEKTGGEKSRDTFPLSSNLLNTSCMRIIKNRDSPVDPSFNNGAKLN
jgi:hypothetical protein